MTSIQLTLSDEHYPLARWLVEIGVSLDNELVFWVMHISIHPLHRKERPIQTG